MTPSAFAESLVAAFAASDASAYFAHFHPEATFLFHDTPGLVASRAAYEALWAEWEREAGFRVLACESTDQVVQEYDDLAVFTHSVHTKRLVDGVTDPTLFSGAFYASGANTLTGPLVNQADFLPDLAKPSFQDHANEAIHRFIT